MLKPGTRIGAYTVNDGGELVSSYTPAVREELGLSEPEMSDPDQINETLELMSEVPLGAPISPVDNRRRRRTWDDQRKDGYEGQGKLAEDGSNQKSNPLA